MIPLTPIGAFKVFGFCVSEIHCNGGKIFPVDVECFLQIFMIGDGFWHDDGFVGNIDEKFLKYLPKVIKKAMIASHNLYTAPFAHTCLVRANTWRQAITSA
jgi:hypothetical protein